MNPRNKAKKALSIIQAIWGTNTERMYQEFSLKS